MDSHLELRGCKTNEELHAVVELCDAAFDKTAKEYFERHLFNDTTLSLDDTRILLKDGVIVSSVQVFPRTIYIGGKRVLMGGIGNVATLPSERKKGHAEKVLRDSMDYVKRKGFKVSLLTTTINEFYEKFGFKTIKRQLIHLNVLPRTDQSRVRVVDWGRDMDRVMQLYDEYNTGSTGPIVRDAAYWQTQFGFCGEDEKLFLVWEEGKEIRGYVRGRKDTDSTRILEYAVRDGEEQILRTLLEDLSFRTRQPKLEVFVSGSEKKRLPFLQLSESEVETSFMIAFFDDAFDTDIRMGSLDEGDFTFWLTDYF